MQPLATPDELADFTKGAIVADDPRLDSVLNGVSSAVRRYCGWHITPVVTESVTLDGPGGWLLSLPSLNVTGITSVTHGGESLTADDDYRWSADGSVKSKSGRWSDEFRDISVTFTHGYAEADVEDVKQVVLSVAARLLSSPTGAVREQAGSVSIAWALTAPGVSGGIALLGHEREVLDHYRIESA